MCSLDASFSKILWEAVTIHHATHSPTNATTQLAYIKTLSFKTYILPPSFSHHNNLESSSSRQVARSDLLMRGYVFSTEHFGASRSGQADFLLWVGRWTRMKRWGMAYLSLESISPQVRFSTLTRWIVAVTLNEYYLLPSTRTLRHRVLLVAPSGSTVAQIKPE